MTEELLLRPQELIKGSFLKDTHSRCLSLLTYLLLV